ncbi:MAG: metallophosphoesterase [Gammaproteobacteria bacterium]|nr:metallophosphoesterase [Gammaproteobacteria bacterium]
MNRGTVKVIQISDTHLFASDESNIFGIKSNLKFNEVMSKILIEDIIDADMILLTGDISQDETQQSYIKVVEILGKLAIPVYWIPGNHDNILQMETVFNNTKNFNFTRTLSLLNWKFIFLNTKLNGSDNGFLDRSELFLLKQEIEKSDGKKLAVVMHHHPLEVNTPLIDNYILKNSDEFWEVINGSKVKLIICGHVHGDYKLKHKRISVETSPATCLQWQRGTKDLKIDKRIGYKIYHFDNAGYNSIAKIW